MMEPLYKRYLRDRGETIGQAWVGTNYPVISISQEYLDNQIVEMVAVPNLKRTSNPDIAQLDLEVYLRTAPTDFAPATEYRDPPTLARGGLKRVKLHDYNLGEVQL